MVTKQIQLLPHVRDVKSLLTSVIVAFLTNYERDGRSKFRQFSALQYAGQPDDVMTCNDLMFLTECKYQLFRNLKDFPECFITVFIL